MIDKIDFQLLSFGMRRIGWIRFWIQSILGVVVTAVLLFSNVVNNNSEGQLSLTPGLSLTTISLILLFLSLWQGWLIIRTGRAIGSNARPSRGQTSKLIKRGILNDLLGILFGLIGYQALMGALFIQASTQTQGIAIEVEFFTSEGDIKEITINVQFCKFDGKFELINYSIK